MLNVKINPVPNSWHGDTPEVLSGVTKTVYLELVSKLSNILAYEYKNLFFLYVNFSISISVRGSRCSYRGFLSAAMGSCASSQHLHGAMWLIFSPPLL